MSTVENPGPYRLAIRELVRRVDGDRDRLRLLLDEWLRVAIGRDLEALKVLLDRSRRAV